jgi:hypothetical protein
LVSVGVEPDKIFVKVASLSQLIVREGGSGEGFEGLIGIDRRHGGRVLREQKVFNKIRDGMCGCRNRGSPVLLLSLWKTARCSSWMDILTTSQGIDNLCLIFCVLQLP